MSQYQSVRGLFGCQGARLFLAVSLTLSLALVLARGVEAGPKDPSKDLVRFRGSALGKVDASTTRPDGSTLIDAEALGHSSLLGETSTSLRYTSHPGTDAEGKPIATLVGDGTLHASNGDKVYITFRALERVESGAPHLHFKGRLQVLGGTGRWLGASGRAKLSGVDGGGGRFAYSFHGRISAPGKGKTLPAPVVPDNLKVPEGQVVLFHALGKGVQIYVCTRSAADPTLFTWVFKAPQADLLDAAGEKVGIHYAGPTWESLGGSKVAGAVLQKSPSPDPTAVPWLLLQAKSTEGAGFWSDIRSIQRVNTTGGQAPAGSCDVEGTELRVDYTADYYFFGPAS
jgi:hypothetical protein